MIIRGFLLVNLLDNLKYIEINYPPNSVDFFTSKENVSTSIIPKYRYPIDPKDQNLIINNNFPLYKAKPYFYNNIGGAMN